MLFKTEWVDVTQFLLTRIQPIALIRREPAHIGEKAWAGSSQVGSLSEFWVPQGDLFTDAVVFNLTRIGDCVRVPLWGYKTEHPSLAALFGLGAQLGVLATLRLAKVTKDVPKMTHMVLGHECTDLRPAEKGFECYIGIAFQTK